MSRSNGNVLYQVPQGSVLGPLILLIYILSLLAHCIIFIDNTFDYTIFVIVCGDIRYKAIRKQHIKKFCESLQTSFQSSKSMIMHFGVITFFFELAEYWASKMKEGLIPLLQHLS